MQELVKSLSQYDLTIIGIASVIGSGIFVLFSKILRDAGNYAPLAILLAAIPNIIMALSYSELTTMYQSAATEVISIKDAFGPTTSAIAAYLIYFFMIFNNITILLIAGTMLASGNMQYVISFLILLTSSVINAVGINISEKIVTTLGVSVIAALIILIVLGVPHWGNSGQLHSQPTNAGIMAAITLSLFLYTGYDTIVKMSEETKDVNKDTPHALINTNIIVAIIYALIAFTAISVPIALKVSQSNVPLSVMGDYLLRIPGVHTFMSFVGFVIIFNCFFVVMISQSRYVYGLAKDGYLPHVLSKIHPITFTPINAILINLIVMTLAMFVKHGEISASLAVVMFLLFMSLIHITVIVLRKKAPQKERPFQVPWNIQNVPVPLIIGIGINVIFIYMAVSYLRNGYA